MHAIALRAADIYCSMREKGHGRFFSGLTVTLIPFTILSILFAPQFLPSDYERREKEEQTRLTAEWKLTEDNGIKPVYEYWKLPPLECLGEKEESHYLVSHIDSNKDNFADITRFEHLQDRNVRYLDISTWKVPMEHFTTRLRFISDFGGRPSRFEY